MAICEPYNLGCLLRIKLTPNAAVCKFGDVVAGADGVMYLKAYVRAVPEKGKANEELIKLLAKKLKIAKSNIKVISGVTDHYKKIHIESTLPADELCAKVEQLAEC